ncbi:hypothetical protein B0T21DRAFT_350973 [Apiosordaria backusii]|uniref:Uncharacterized protein n=1 Tax=Apiosordaria backusii TaxID=314023 RepID=A0AA40AXI7_9PEZI|nr:hypothetical protein B0T21DRAFT_350973 [Apiosordaria backusii]
MTPFDIQVHCYALKKPSNEHHHLECPVNILKDLPTDAWPDHVMTRASGGTLDNHVGFIPIEWINYYRTCQRQSYCHGVVQTGEPWPNEKGDKLWLRSDVPLIPGRKDVPVYNITKGMCCMVWIDNVEWRWHMQSIPATISPSNTFAARRSANSTRKLVIAGPVRDWSFGTIKYGNGDPDYVRLAIIFTEASPTACDGGKKQWWQRFSWGKQQSQQSQIKVDPVRVKELEAEWEDIVEEWC